MQTSPLAGTPAGLSVPVDVDRLVTAYYRGHADPTVPAQRVAFGTSGHRGSAFLHSFNEDHVLAIAQAICHYRVEHGITGPLFLVRDTHALSWPALTTTLAVLAANDVEVMLATGGEFTPTPAVSWAILNYNRGRKNALADGIILTPSHNPPADGGLKYNPPHGGPAGEATTSWIEEKANSFLEAGVRSIRRLSPAQVLRAETIHHYDFLRHYVDDLGSVVDLEAIRTSGLKLGVDPLGGASVRYWPRIAERYGLNLTVINPAVDPTFQFMTLDWDGQIRMDPSSRFALHRLIAYKDRFDLAFACDPDSDRHGIVTPTAGLLPANHYLAAAASYLFSHRPGWATGAAIGKTVVTTQLLDRLAAKVGRRILEVPVGFKWFADGLLDGSLGFAGEESAGASFARRDGRVWTTDKDGLVPALLAGEIMAKTGRDPGQLYRELTADLGEPAADRREALATVEEKSALARLAPEQVELTELAGEKIERKLNRAPGNGAAIGGLKVITKSGWFAARPSGTEPLYRIYGESFRGADHLQRLLDDAQAIVAGALATVEAPAT